MSYWYCENPSTKSGHKSNYMFSQYNCPNDADAASKCCVQGCSSNCIPDQYGEKWCETVKDNGDIKLVEGSNMKISYNECRKLFQVSPPCNNYDNWSEWTQGKWSDCYEDKECCKSLGNHQGCNRNDCIKADCEKQGGYYDGIYSDCGKGGQGPSGPDPTKPWYFQGHCGMRPFEFENQWARIWNIDSSNGCCYTGNPDFTPPSDCQGKGEYGWKSCAENIGAYLKKRYGIYNVTPAESCQRHPGEKDGSNFACCPQGADNACIKGIDADPMQVYGHYCPE